MRELDKQDKLNEVFKLIRENGSVSTTKDLLLEKYDLWKSFNYTDWLIVLEKIKNHPLKLYGFITFAYIILGIELIHEFLNLKEVDQKVILYFDRGTRFPIHSISERDIKYYQNNKLVIEEIQKTTTTFKDQGAIIIEEYPVRTRKVVENLIKRYVRIVKRTEITKIAPNELCEEKYLVSEKRVKKREKNT